MTNAEQMLEAVAEPVRRQIVERLVAQPSAVTDLAAEMPISRSAVSQHLQVLKRAHVVDDRASGTRRIYHVDPDALAILRAYFESFWSRSLDTFRELVEADNREDHEADAPTAR